ncbi:MAG TPA: nucleoside-diphosphate sugar epimerase/dehydratase, partial [Vicinamibacteria bacterium]|nr:nucleoside-diphosphate sugar epimerase/dehydratase [Vicinamibacteria bacterium]
MTTAPRGGLVRAALAAVTGLGETLRWFSGWRRYALIYALDAAAIAFSFHLGFLIRFEGRVPAEYQEVFWTFLPLLLLVRLTLQTGLGIHRWSFRLSGLHEAVRVVATCGAGSAAFVSLVYFLQRVGPPRSVLIIEWLLTTVLLGALRFSPRYAHEWLVTQVRSQSPARVRALIVGAGSAGELLMRELQRSDEHSYEVLGFVDDNPGKWRTTIGGRPVLGSLEALPEIVEKRGVRELLFAIPNLPAARVREVLGACASFKLTYRSLPAAFSSFRERGPLATLQQLTPEDLLHRPSVAFDPTELRTLVTGRRILVTGAGGSIGSEIARQVAALGPARLVLADVNENELYLLFRQLQQDHPGLELRAEVVNMRDRERVLRLGAEQRPQDVFHAAAHKHVPLMEEAPEEAIKNNVTACRIAAEMAGASGAERFVLISTDKAVKPTSVMGASKRVAELVVRDFARRSATRFTAVRFGNVLGSAGSVVPLFKAQIARGGPVTVTHPEVRRYIMTIREAVGLVILAGLGGFGDLCILEMGEPIRILDLARLMITLGGLAPERDVPIAFTGLRPGEKLDEELLSEPESRKSRSLRQMIRVVETEPPSDGTLRAIASLE